MCEHTTVQDFGSDLEVYESILKQSEKNSTSQQARDCGHTQMSCVCSTAAYRYNFVRRSPIPDPSQTPPRPFPDPSQTLSRPFPDPFQTLARPICFHFGYDGVFHIVMQSYSADGESSGRLLERVRAGVEWCGNGLEGPRKAPKVFGRVWEVLEK